MKIKEKGDWDGDDNSTCGKWKEPFIDSILVKKYLIESGRQIYLSCLEVNRCKDEVYPRSHEGHEGSVDDDWFRKWQGNLSEDLKSSCPINHC